MILRKFARVMQYEESNRIRQTDMTHRIDELRKKCLYRWSIHWKERNATVNIIRNEVYQRWTGGFPLLISASLAGKYHVDFDSTARIMTLEQQRLKRFSRSKDGASYTRNGAVYLCTFAVSNRFETCREHVNGSVYIKKISNTRKDIHMIVEQDRVSKSEQDTETLLHLFHLHSSMRGRRNWKD